jgi:putative chitinase
MNISRGSEDVDSIKLIQKKLGLTSDGNFGPKTELAVKNFQGQNRLIPTGIVDNNTWVKMGLNKTSDKPFISIGQVKRLTGISNDDIVSEITEELNYVSRKFNINTKLRLSHFLAQILHESDKFRLVKENLYYSTKGLLTTFKKYFKTEEVASQYAKKPNKIANKVYANRMGNGSPESNDGARFIGRGYIQITGRNNYTKLSNDLNIDFLSKPELLEEIKYAMLSAGWYWNVNNLNILADRDDLDSITRVINGGTNGLSHRAELLDETKSMF